MWLYTSNVVFKDERITGYYRRPAPLFCETSFRIHFVCHVQWVRSHLMRVMVRRQSGELCQCVSVKVYNIHLHLDAARRHKSQRHRHTQPEGMRLSDLFTHSVIFKHAFKTHGGCGRRASAYIGMGSLVFLGLDVLFWKKHLSSWIS